MARPRHIAVSLAVGLLIVLQLAAPVDANNSKAVIQFNRLVLKRNYEKSAAVLNVAARAGDAEAQYRLANLYRVGLGVPRDDSRARLWLKRASGKGLAKAQRLLARLDASSLPKTGPVQRQAKGDSQIFLPPVKADEKDKSGLSWMSRAAARGQTRALAAFAGGAGHLPSPLLAAAAAGQSDAALLLIRSGAPVNAADSQGRTALMFAAASTDAVLATGLLSSGADITQQDNQGYLALHYAIRSCNAEAAIALSRALPSAGVISQGPPILQLAIDKCRNIEVIGMLLQHVDIDGADEIGRTGMWLAASLGETDIVKLLLARHAKVMLMDRDGMTPLHAAALRCRPDIASLLLEAGADANAAARDGNTPLMLAAASDCTGVQAILIAARAAIDAVNQQGDAPLLIAVRAGSLEAVKLLLAAGAAADARNARRETPAIIAGRLERMDIAALLPSP